MEKCEKQFTIDFSTVYTQREKRKNGTIPTETQGELNL